MKLNTVICGDCLDVMQDMEDNSVDLVVTSPPYNMGGKSLGYKPSGTISHKHYDIYNDDINEEKYVDWCREIIKECLRCSRYVIWNVQPVISTRKHIIDLQNHFYNNLKEYFIWEKQAVANITAKYGALAKGFEFVFLMGQDNKATFNYHDFPKNKYVPNIKTWYKSENFKEHAATFPRELPSYFIRNFTKKGDIVLDPFLGSGTTAVACKELGRNYIGIEISPEYCAIAEKRLAQGILNI